MDLWVIHALEEAPPAHADPVEWFLLTTLTIGSAEDAEQCLRWYCLRWRIEDWHRVLKSGCRIEALGHESAERLRRAIAINLVIAWRIMLMTLLGRQTPQRPAEVVFSDIALRTLSAYVKKKLEASLETGGGGATRSADRRLPRASQGSASRSPTDLARLHRVSADVSGLRVSRG